MIVSGSGLERFVRCRASSVLPRVWAQASEHAARGTAIHAYLERIGNGSTVADALALVPDEHREACEAINLDEIADSLRLSPEVALAYNPRNDSARVLGSGLARDYSAITDDEIPLTVDLAGLKGDTAIAEDYKTGHRTLTPAADNWQIRGAALAVARAHDKDAARGALVYLRNGRAWKDEATFDALDLLGFAAELRATWERAHADRARHASGGHVEPSEGSWCRYCPCAWSCPAKVGLVRAALGGELAGPVRAVDAGRLLPRVTEAMRLLGAVKAQIVALAASEPIRLSADGDEETWIGEVVAEGNERLDARIAIDQAAAVLGIEDRDAFALEVASLEITKSSLDAAVKRRAPRGKGAATVRAVLDAIRLAGGATRPTVRRVETYTTKRGESR